MSEQYKTVREVIEMLDEKGIILASEACGDVTDPSLIQYATIEALINEIDPEYFDEDDEDLYEIPIKYIEEDEWQDAGMDGLSEDFFHEEIKAHPPEAFRDKSNGE